MKPKRRHLVYAVSGLLLTGTGLSVTGHAIGLRVLHPDAWLWWAGWGTLGLVLFNAGLCLVIEASQVSKQAKVPPGHNREGPKE